LDDALYKIDGELDPIRSSVLVKRLLGEFLLVGLPTTLTLVGVDLLLLLMLPLPL
jgi:hypothetical protein